MTSLRLGAPLDGATEVAGLYNDWWESPAPPIARAIAPESVCRCRPPLEWPELPAAAPMEGWAPKELADAALLLLPAPCADPVGAPSIFVICCSDPSEKFALLALWRA
jgi:hypothetical protein